VNRDSDHSSRGERLLRGHWRVAALGTPSDSANGGWLRRLVEPTNSTRPPLLYIR